MQLLERASQLQALESALNVAKTGEGCVALVYGEAGIGKTTLVEHFTKQKRETWRILVGPCDLLFTPRPLGPLGDIALQTKGRLLSLLDAGGERDALFSACLTELKRRPTILVIEDIHWADEATLDLLKYLGRRMRQTTCLMILTYRDDEIGTDTPLRLLLGDLSTSPGIHRVPVSALSVDGVRELAKGRKVDAAALHRLTNGNPFFLTEVLAGEGGIPQTVRDAMLARAARLSRPGRDALEAASVAGLWVEGWLLAQMSGDGEGIEECVSKGLLRAQEDEYAFRHELARQAILESVAVGRKRALHRTALTALKERPGTRGDLTRLASHAEGTKDADAVLQYMPAAARQAAAAGAHRQAAALYERALEFAAALPAAQHARMLEAYADERWFQGRKERLIPVRQEIIEKYRALGDRLREGVNLAMLAVELHMAGRGTESEDAICAALGILEALPPSVELARAYRAQSILLSEQINYVESVPAGEKAIALAEHFGDMDILARACNFAGYPLLVMGDERGSMLMRRSLTVGREQGLDYAVGLTMANWVYALLVTFRLEEADSLVQEGIAYTTRHDDDYHLAGLLAFEAEIKMYQGHWTTAAELIRQDLERPGVEAMLRVEARRILGRLGVRRGDPDAQQLLKEALGSFTEGNSLEPVGTIRAGLAEAAWLRGDGRAATEEALANFDQFAGQHIPWLTGELAFWRWRAGEAFTPPEWIAKPYALQIAGDWCEAAKEWEQRGCPYEQASALMDGDEAAQLAALEIFERLGARPIIEKLKQQMRAEGMRSIPRGPRPATRGNRFGLTAREMELLACLVKGVSNNAIAAQLSLSPRTVEHHIASMLQKTRTQSRSELIALARRERLLPAG